MSVGSVLRCVELMFYSVSYHSVIYLICLEDVYLDSVLSCLVISYMLHPACRINTAFPCAELLHKNTPDNSNLFPWSLEGSSYRDRSYQLIDARYTYIDCTPPPPNKVKLATGLMKDVYQIFQNWQFSPIFCTLLNWCFESEFFICVYFSVNKGVIQTYALRVGG